MSRAKWFTDDELEGMTDETVQKFDKLRDILGFPLILTSGFRSPEKNQSVIGAVPDSSHCKGMAGDFRVRSSHEAYAIVMAAKEVGINRIGIYVDSYWNHRHLHLDIDPEKIAEVIFIKAEQN